MTSLYIGKNDIINELDSNGLSIKYDYRTEYLKNNYVEINYSSIAIPNNHEYFKIKYSRYNYVIKTFTPNFELDSPVGTYKFYAVTEERLISQLNYDSIYIVAYNNKVEIYIKIHTDQRYRNLLNSSAVITLLYNILVAYPVLNEINRISKKMSNVKKLLSKLFDILLLKRYLN